MPLILLRYNGIMLISTEQAIDALKQQQPVALPTETVYGLAAKISSPSAIETVFSLKQRPLDHPLIVHIADNDAINRYGKDLPDYVQSLIETFWPGPLTLIVKKTDLISDMITAGQDTVAIRMPAHPIFQTILQQLDAPLVAPSANRFCQTSPTSAMHVEAGLGIEVAVVDGGECAVGIESTIIDVTQPDHITLLRPGILTAKVISKVAGVDCLAKQKTSQKFSGSHQKHYAPTKLIQLIDDVSELDPIKNAYCMLLTPVKSSANTIIPMPKTVKGYANALYRHWHLAQASEVEKIVIERPPQTAEWQGVNDRISKAAHCDD